jgi:hypothetical protein
MEAILANETLIVFVAVTFMFVVPWVAHYWYKARVAEVNAALKMEMVRRGMSADEILAVLEGPAPSGRPKRQRCRSGSSDEQFAREV